MPLINSKLHHAESLFNSHFHLCRRLCLEYTLKCFLRLRLRETEHNKRSESLFKDFRCGFSL